MTSCIPDWTACYYWLESEETKGGEQLEWKLTSWGQLHVTCTSSVFHLQKLLSLLLIIVIVAVVGSLKAFLEGLSASLLQSQQSRCRRQQILWFVPGWEKELVLR